MWDFDVDQILSANTSGVAAVIPDTDDICVTPLLYVNAVSCNCSNFPATDKVLLPPVDETPERGNCPQPPMRNDTVDAPNGNNSDKSDEDHWFSDESEGVMLVILSILFSYYMILLLYYIIILRFCLYYFIIIGFI